jgi:uncharacterized protein involved in exopolysaccharide biosynthesis
MTAPTTRRDDVIALGDYLSGLWRYRVPIAVITLAAMALALVISLRAPRVYETTLTMMVSSSKFGDQLGQPASISVASFRPLIESRSIAAIVIRELALDKPPHGLTPSGFLAGVLSLEEVRGTNLIRLTVRYPDPVLAATIARRVAEVGISVANKVNTDEAGQARDIIKEQVDLAMLRYDRADKAVRSFKDTAQIEALKKDVEGTLAIRGTLLELLVKVEAERARLTRIDQELAKRTRVDTLKKTVDDGPILTEGARAGGATPAGAAGLQLRTEAVSEVYETLDAEAAKIRANLAALEKQKAQLVDVRDIDASKLPKLSLLYAREGELARLEVERDIAQKSYVGVATLYESARLQVAARSARLEVIDPAVAPDQPLPRNTLRDTALAGIAAFSVAALAAMLAAALRPTKDALSQ